MSPLGIWRSLYDEQPVVVELFELLWKSGARVPIPDTLVYKFGRLDAWFFVSKSGQLKQKKNQTVVEPERLRQGARAPSATALRHANDIAAVWAGGAPGSPARILHITRDNLLPFLLEMPDKGHGVLHAMITPTTEQQHPRPRDVDAARLRARVPPELVLSMRPSPPPLAERLATFEGDRPHVSTYTPSSGRINQHVLDQSAAYATEAARALDERCAQFFAAAILFAARILSPRNLPRAHSHALRYTASRVWRLVLTFKADARGAVWLCWCSKLQLATLDDGGFFAAALLRHRRRHRAADADALVDARGERAACAADDGPLRHD